VIRHAFQSKLKVGDLVQYADPNVEQAIGMVIYIYEAGKDRFNREMVDILWAEGDMWIDSAYEFEVISAGR